MDLTEVSIEAIRGEVKNTGNPDIAGRSASEKTFLESDHAPVVVEFELP